VDVSVSVKGTEMYTKELQYMEGTLLAFTKALPKPIEIILGESIAYRYLDQGVAPAIIQKLARMLNGLHASKLLLEHGLLLDHAALLRMIDENSEDITFLTFAHLGGSEIELLKRFLTSFYQEEYDDPLRPLETHKSRDSIPRKKIRAAISRMSGVVQDQSKSQKVGDSLTKSFSGYVHGASPHIMELYDPSRVQFGVNGDPHQNLLQDCNENFWNPVYRGILAFAFAAKALS
jgi:hypothetical protein